MRCVAPGGRRAGAVRTFPFLLLPFFPLLIDRGGAVAGVGPVVIVRGVVLRLAPGFSAWLVALCAVGHIMAASCQKRMLESDSGFSMEWRISKDQKIRS